MATANTFDPSNHSPAALDVVLERRRERLRSEAANQAATLKARQVEGVRVVGPWAPCVRVIGCRNINGD